MKISRQEELSAETNLHTRKAHYIPVIMKFELSQLLAVIWTGFSIYISIPWVKDLAEIVTLPLSLLIIAGIAYIPGYLNAFMLTSLVLDRQPPFKDENPLKDITILIAARNEANNIENTLYILQNRITEAALKCLSLITVQRMRPPLLLYRQLKGWTWILLSFAKIILGNSML